MDNTIETNPKATVPQANEDTITSTFFNPEITDDEWAITKVGQTPTGKTVSITKRKQSHGYEIHFAEGGRRPKPIDGWFTNYDGAEKAARLYLNGLWLDKEAEELKQQAVLDKMVEEQINAKSATN